MFNDAFALALFNSKLLVALSVALVALDLQIDPPMATIIVGVLVAMSSAWQSWTLSKVHTAVNSNFSEAKAGRLAAEAALKTSQDLNAYLQQQLIAKPSTVLVEVVNPSVKATTELAAVISQAAVAGATVPTGQATGKDPAKG